ncbi:MAG: hypothetical protein WCE81_08950 [Halobacteriota archaeon]
MAKYLTLWHLNPMAVPLDPAEHVKLNEMLYAMMDNMLKTGEITEFGFFLEGCSGYTMSEGESADTFRKVTGFFPVITVESREIIPYETGKEILRGVWNALAEAAKK